MIWLASRTRISFYLQKSTSVAVNICSTKFLYLVSPKNITIGILNRKIDILYSYRNLHAEKIFDIKAQEKINSDIINFVFKDDLGWANLLSSDIQPFINELLFGSSEQRPVARYTFTTADFRNQKSESDFDIINPNNHYYYTCFKFVDLIYVT